MSAKPRKKALLWFLLGAVVVVAAGITITLSVRPCLISNTVTTVLLVRHAEKAASGNDDPKGPRLCEPFGTERAQELAHVAGQAGVNVIYRTEYLRTLKTIEPLDDIVSGNATYAYEANDVDGIVNKIRDHHRGEVVFVVGHSNTVPRIIEGLGGPTQLDGGNIPDNDYDNLYVVTLTCFCGTWVTTLQYGRTSPLTEQEAAQCSSQ